jgi:hypothetical protein
VGDAPEVHARPSHHVLLEFLSPASPKPPRHVGENPLDFRAFSTSQILIATVSVCGAVSAKATLSGSESESENESESLSLIVFFVIVSFSSCYHGILFSSSNFESFANSLSWRQNSSRSRSQSRSSGSSHYRLR